MLLHSAQGGRADAARAAGGRFSLWREVHALSPHELAMRMRADGIDIAIDLSGHSEGRRLPALALRAAPVQVSYVGYANTTGVAAIDARIVDSLTDPPGTDVLATERLVRIDPCFVCYRPPTDAPPVAVRPEGGPVVFASFSAMPKLNPRVLDVWARLLAGTPGSSITIKNRVAPAVRAHMDAAFAARGVDSARVLTPAWSGTAQDHLASYAGVDIILDPFPYNGTTSTCEALHMGVPVVTLAGDRHASRVGLSLLTAVGLPELAAKDEDGYIAIARSLAVDRTRLAELRQGLRARLAGSPLRDEAGFAARFGGALRALWREACPKC